MEDKEKILPVKVPQTLKDSFIRACKNQDTNASRELRDYMRRYVAQHGQEKLL